MSAAFPLIARVQDTRNTNTQPKPEAEGANAERVTRNEAQHMHCKYMEPTHRDRGITALKGQITLDLLIHKHLR